MMSNSMFDILMEIRTVDKQISEEKLKVQKSQNELSTIEININKIKQLQLKALSILKDTERKSKYTCSELSDIHKSYKALVKYFDAPEIEPECTLDCIEKLKKQRDDLKDKIIKARSNKEEIAMEINNIDLQISIQKKKNTAMLLRLQKNLQESLEEEQIYLNQVKSTNVNKFKINNYN